MGIGASHMRRRPTKRPKDAQDFRSASHLTLHCLLLVAWADDRGASSLEEKPESTPEPGLGFPTDYRTKFHMIRAANKPKMTLLGVI